MVCIVRLSDGPGLAELFDRFRYCIPPFSTRLSVYYEKNHGPALSCAMLSFSIHFIACLRSSWSTLTPNPSAFAISVQERPLLRRESSEAPRLVPLYQGVLCDQGDRESWRQGHRHSRHADQRVSEERFLSPLSAHAELHTSQSATEPGRRRSSHGREDRERKLLL